MPYLSPDMQAFKDSLDPLLILALEKAQELRARVLAGTWSVEDRAYALSVLPKVDALVAALTL